MAHPNAHTPTSRRHAAAASVFNNVHPKAAPIIWKLARHIYAITRTGYAGVWIGRGWDPKSSEHGTGRALDIMFASKVGRRVNATERAAGDAVVNWLVANAKTLHIRHIIWNRRIYRTRYAAWGPLPGRTAKSSVSDWHEDHAHVLLQDTTGDVPNTMLAGKPAPKPAPPKTTTLREDKPPRRYSAAVKTLQTELRRIFPAYARRLAADGYFGPATTKVVKEFQRRHGHGLAVDGIVGNATRTALRSHGARV